MYQFNNMMVIFAGADEQSDKSETTSDATKNYKFDGKHYVHTDQKTNVTYKFIQEQNEWVVKDDKEDKTENEKGEDDTSTEPANAEVYGFEDDTRTYTDPNDGMKYFWDREKNAWFPKVLLIVLYLKIDGYINVHFTILQCNELQAIQKEKYLIRRVHKIKVMEWQKL